MTEEQHAFIEKSHRALASARRMLKAEDPEGAIDRAYFAAFDAGRGGRRISAGRRAWRFVIQP